MRRIILATFHICKALGLFRLARRLTRRDLRILCYHGFVLDDEDRFRGSLFVSRAFLDRRMRYLQEQGYRVLPLDETVERLADGTLPPDPVAITIDDGSSMLRSGAAKAGGLPTSQSGNAAPATCASTDSPKMSEKASFSAPDSFW